MSELIKEFNLTGPCIIDLTILYKKWNKTFTLAKYHDQYSLSKRNGKNGGLKVSISSDQALEIINELKLVEIKDDTFNHARTYRSKNDIEKDIDNLMKTYTEKLQEATIIGNVIQSYRNAINK